MAASPAATSGSRSSPDPAIRSLPDQPPQGRRGRRDRARQYPKEDLQTTTPSRWRLGAEQLARLAWPMSPRSGRSGSYFGAWCWSSARRIPEPIRGGASLGRLQDGAAGRFGRSRALLERC